MVLDYSERRTVTRNRPKKQPIGLFVFIVTGAVVLSFAAGLFSGWLMFRPRKQAATASVAQHPDQATQAAPPAAGAAVPAEAQRGQDPPLTFYETLSKGNSNALIGSGINAKKIAEAAPGKPAVPVQPPHSEPKGQKPDALHASEAKRNPPVSAVTDPEKRSATLETANEATKKTEAKPVRYTVQVASFREKKEAEAAVTRLLDKGLAAYVSELKTVDKGVWYRVRVGKRLDQNTASDLAARAGKGAIPLPE